MGTTTISMLNMSFSTGLALFYISVIFSFIFLMVWETFNKN